MQDFCKNYVNENGNRSFITKYTTLPKTAEKRRKSKKRQINHVETIYFTQHIPKYQHKFLPRQYNRVENFIIIELDITTSINELLHLESWEEASRAIYKKKLTETVRCFLDGSKIVP